jgi:hypothetical protein
MNLYEKTFVVLRMSRKGPKLCVFIGTNIRKKMNVFRISGMVVW